MSLETNIKLSYLQQKIMKKIYGKHIAFEIALHRRLMKIIDYNWIE